MRDFIYTFTRHFPLVFVALRSQSRLTLEGRTRTLSESWPDLSPARTLASSSRRNSALSNLTELHYQLGKPLALHGHPTYVARGQQRQRGSSTEPRPLSGRSTERVESASPAFCRCHPLESDRPERPHPCRPTGTDLEGVWNVL